MLNKKNPHIKFILSQNTTLSTLVKHTHYLSQINCIVQRQLTDTLRQHCKVTNYRENTLYLHVDSPAWATRLRFSLPELLSQLRNSQELKELREIRIYQVQLTTPQEKNKKPSKLGLSKDTAEQLNCLANDVTDPRLASALRRLAKRTG